MSKNSRRSTKHIKNPSSISKASTMLAAAVQYHQEGHLVEAESKYRQILAIDPKNHNCYNNLGLMAYNSGRRDEAEALFNQAIALHPNDPDILNNLGNLFQSQGKLDLAEQALTQAIRGRPDFSGAHVNLGIILHSQGKFEPALACYQRALRLNPNLGEAYLNLGNTLDKLRRWDEAIDAYQRSLVLKPHHAMTYSNLGAVLRNNGNLKEAEISLRQALLLKPDYVPANINLGTLLTDLGKTADAITCFERVIAIEPSHAGALSNMLFSYNYIDIIDPQTLAQKYFQMGTRFEEKFLLISPNHHNNPDPHRKLRIGYVSPDFRKHAVTFFLEPLIRAHNRGMIEIFCYADVFMPDEMTAQLQQLADHWLSVLGMHDDELAERIRADEIDILIDLAGHSAHNRLLTFARRPAPVQITWLGYPNTTGLTSMDYRLVDAITDPPGFADTLATETLIRMKDGFHCYQVPVGVPDPAPPPCLKTGMITFGSFNNVAKISPSTMDVWCKLLTRLPTSRLLLKSWIFADSGTSALILSRFMERGIAPERVTLLSAIADIAEHIGAYRQIDIALDSFPYNGTTTTCEALWMGIPVVTLLGDRHLARVGASLLTQVGLQELIGRSHDEYIDIALKLANDYSRLTELHQSLRARMAASPLSNVADFTRKLEAVYRDLWQRWCARIAPATAQSSAAIIAAPATSNPQVIELFARALQHYHAGQQDIAEYYCRHIMQLDQNHADSQQLLTTIMNKSANRTLVDENTFNYQQMMATTLQSQGKIKESVEHFTQALALQADASLHSNLLRCMLYRSAWSRQEIFAAHRQFDSLYCRHLLASDSQYPNSKDPERKLKIGYVATSFSINSVRYFIQPLLKHFNSNRYENYVYHLETENTLQENKLTNDVIVNWRSLSAVTDDQLIKIIQTDGIDILVDLCGHSPGNRLLTFARKPAPVQMSWLYPETTGLTAMDYRLVDAVSEPLRNADNFSSEQLIRIEGGFLCFNPPDTTTAINPLPVLQQGIITFGAFAHHEKISDEVLQTWSEIINQVPGSRILLTGEHGEIFDQEQQDLWQQRLTTWGIAPARQLFSKNSSAIDIVLDTFPYNGVNAMCNALWIGLPVITVAGDHHASRMGASIMTHAGLTELVASTREDYIKLAVGLALDQKRLIALHDDIRDRLLRSPLCDVNRFVRYVELAYQAIWKKWCNAQPPEAICIQIVRSAVDPSTVIKPLSIVDGNTASEYILYAKLADAEVGLRNKRVLEIGNSLSPDFIFNVLGVTQWISVLPINNYEQFRTAVPVIKINEITSFSQLARHSVLLGSIEDLPTCLDGCFDIVFSLNSFERILCLGRAFEMMAAALTPVGKLFAMFFPIWTAYNGHHLPNLTDRSGRNFDSTEQSPIPPWAHLYWRPSQMYIHLLQHTDAPTAAKIIDYVYHAPHINRLFVEDYIDYFTASPFVGQVVKTHLINLLAPVQQLLESIYPRRHHFDNHGLKMVLTRRLSMMNKIEHHDQSSHAL